MPTLPGAMDMQLFRTMLRIRCFEEATAKLFAHGELPGFVHLYVGEEAIATGVCSVLRPDDLITSTHRGHGHLIAKGGDLKLMMAELFGKASGYCKGKGGSMHIADLSLGILGANGIVGGGFGIAVGAAYSAKLRGSPQVVVDFFGDGAANEGVFHEALNMAAAWDLPIVFVCENNQFGVSTRIDRVVHETDLCRRAGAYGMKGVQVDGNDVHAVRAAAEEAIGGARSGTGPTLLVCTTFRHRGHFEGESVTYLSHGELDAWKEKDPIHRIERALSEGDVKSIKAEIEQEIEQAISFARTSPFPEPAEAVTDLFFENAETRS